MKVGLILYLCKYLIYVQLTNTPLSLLAMGVISRFAVGEKMILDTNKSVFCHVPSLFHKIFFRCETRDSFELLARNLGVQNSSNVEHYGLS